MATHLGARPLDRTARDALGSACADVRDAQESDHVDGVLPAVVVRPSDTAQVSEVLRASAAHRLSVIPTGRGTKLSWAAPPSSADVLLDVSALDRVVDHAAGDLIVVTQAGTTLAGLQDVVGQGGQRLALDETVPGASIGGTLATNASGPRRVAVGTARDLLIGITMVRADGVVAKSGGRVVKNVAGYDVGKLLIGSFGTLGVITEAVFRLHPTPVARRWVSVDVEDPGQAQACVQSVLHAQAVPAAIEVDWAEHRGTVSVLMEGRDEGVAGRAAAVAALLGETATHSEDPPAGGAAYPWDAGAIGDQRATALKLTFVLSGLADVLAAADETGVRVRGSAGAGVAYGAIDPDAPATEVAATLDRMRAVAARHDGTVVVVDGPTAVKRALDVWGPIPAIDLMRSVKDEFDPDHRLSPGRFAGGI